MNEDFKKHMEEIWDDVSRIVENRYVFKRLRELLELNLGIIANVFFDHYVVNYANAITLSVRRQIDVKTSRGGLVAMLQKILKDPSLIKKEDYVTHIKAYARKELAESLWEERFGGLDYIDPKIIEEDILLLETITLKAKDYVDKNVAHKDKNHNLFTLTYGELDEAINLLERLTIKYYSLLVNPGAHANGLLAGNIQGWENIFLKPWVTEITPDTQFERDIEVV